MVDHPVREALRQAPLQCRMGETCGERIFRRTRRARVDNALRWQNISLSGRGRCQSCSGARGGMSYVNIPYSVIASDVVANDGLQQSCLPHHVRTYSASILTQLQYSVIVEQSTWIAIGLSHARSHIILTNIDNI